MAPRQTALNKNVSAGSPWTMGFLLLLSLVALGIGFVLGTRTSSPSPLEPPQTACTMDAKICPDGTAVGREGPHCEFSPCPQSSTPSALPTGDTQTVPPSTTASAPVSINPLTTVGWKRVSLGGVSFQIPPEAHCDSDLACSHVVYEWVDEASKQKRQSTITVGVEQYTGGSRRDQFFLRAPGTRECKPIYVETRFGSVPALQIAIDGGWCQGGYDGAIVAVVGDAFVIVGPGLAYNGELVISRWDIRDTLVSTLRPQ